MNSRDRQRSRAIVESLPKCVAELARGTGWRASQGVLFRKIGDLFVSSSIHISVTNRVAGLRMSAKPLALDPLFWDILDLADNASQPLSFRYFGSFICEAPNVKECAIDETLEDPQKIARLLVSWSNQELLKIPTIVTPFTKYLLDHPSPDGRGKYRACLITSLILDGNYGHARELAENAIRERDAAGYMVGFSEFPHMALKWIRGIRSQS